MTYPPFIVCFQEVEGSFNPLENLDKTGANGMTFPCLSILMIVSRSNSPSESFIPPRNTWTIRKKCFTISCIFSTNFCLSIFWMEGSLLTLDHIECNYIINRL